MIDAAIFAGLATHLQVRAYDVRGGGRLYRMACGTTGVPDNRRTTEADPRRVDCLRCRRTRAYRDARARAMPHRQATYCGASVDLTLHDARRGDRVLLTDADLGIHAQVWRVATPWQLHARQVTLAEVCDDPACLSCATSYGDAISRALWNGRSPVLRADGSDQPADPDPPPWYGPGRSER